MTIAVPSEHHCQHCRTTQQVRTQLMGDKILLRCLACSNWIRCPDCMYMKSIDHNCPLNITEVSS